MEEVRIERVLEGQRPDEHSYSVVGQQVDLARVKQFADANGSSWTSNATKFPLGCPVGTVAVVHNMSERTVPSLRRVLAGGSY